MKIKVTAKEYLMEAVCRWDEESAGYYEVSDREKQLAWRDLQELARRCKQLLPKAKPKEHHSAQGGYLEQLWFALQALKRGRPDAACGYLHSMLYCNLHGETADCGILANIIGLVEDTPYAFQKAEAIRKCGR